MRDKAMPLGKKFKVRLTITPEQSGHARVHGEAARRAIG